MTEHSWEDNTSFSHTTMSSGFVYTRGNALLPYLSLSSRFAIVTRSDSSVSLRPGTQAETLASSLPQLPEAGGHWSLTHQSAPLR